MPPGVGRPIGRGGIEPGVGRGAPATPPGVRPVFPVNGLLPAPARGVRVGVLPENGLFPGRAAGLGGAGDAACAAGASGAAGADGSPAGAGAGAGAGVGAAAAGAAGVAGAGVGGAGAAAAGVAADGAGVGAAAGVAGAARRTVVPDDVRRGGVVVGVSLPPSASRSLRATGGSTVEEADLANSPISFSFSRTCLLSSPNSLASS